MEQLSGCRIPGCQCEGRIEYMEWDSDDMTDSEDSEWEDPEERENRLWVEQYNFDLIEGMTLMTYTPPPRKNRRRRYEDKVKYILEVQESKSCSKEMGAPNGRGITPVGIGITTENGGRRRYPLV